MVFASDGGAHMNTIFRAEHPDIGSGHRITHIFINKVHMGYYTTGIYAEG